MKLRYFLRRNTLSSKGQAPYLPITVRNGSLTAEAFYRGIARRTTLTIPDIRGVMQSALEVLMRELGEGRNVQTDFGTFSPSVSGNFTEVRDRYDRERHEIRIRFKVNPAIGSFVRDNADVEMVTQTKKIPVPLLFINVADGHEHLTGAGALIRIEGDQMDPEQGVFFIDPDGNETRLEQVASQSAKLVTGQMPDSLVPGPYTLCARKKYGQELREGKLPGLIEYQSP